MLAWGGGSYLFNRWFEPVILHASLVSTADGHEIWSDHVFVTTDTDALKKLPKAQQALRQVPLRVTADSAVHSLVGELNDAAKLRYENRATVFSSADVGNYAY